MNHVIFSGGGTGGHLFPGLAVAERLTAEWPHARITFAGGGKPWERRAVAAAGFDYLPLGCRAFPRRLRDVAGFVAANLAGYRAAVRYLGWRDVSVVIGLGGYASVPMARAAVRAKVPLVLLEQNVVPGRATRWLARSAAMVCTAFEETAAHLSRRSNVRVTGNPVRNQFAGRPMLAAHGPHRHAPLGLTALADNPTGTPKPHRQILVLGGTAGARSLNQSVPGALRRQGHRMVGWKIIHQSGEAELDATRRLYAAAGFSGHQVDVHPFISDMPAVLAQSDLAICRAGGTTLAELAAAGVPAVLVPYPHAADDHQRKNAEVFAASGGAILLDERELGERLEYELAAAVTPLLADDACRTMMAAAIRRRAHPDAAWDVATLIRHLAWTC